MEDQSDQGATGATNETQFIKFLKERLEKHGSLNLQNLTGHLSALPSHLRATYGTSKSSLKKFLKEHPDHFTLDKKENVEIACKPSPMPAAKVKDAMAPSKPASGIVKVVTAQPKEKIVSELLEVTGKVTRIFEFFGFITILEPFYASIYFDVQSFEQAQFKSFNDAKLKLGEDLSLNAHLGPENCEAQYRASAVWRTEPLKVTDKSDKRAKSSEEIEGKGHVHNLFTTYGFISQSSNMKDNVFFHFRIFSATSDSSKSLQDVLKIGDKVCFRAKPSQQKDSPVKWQATAVWLNDTSNVRQQSTSSTKNDIYISSAESSLDLESDRENEDDDVYDGEGEYKSEDFESEETNLPSKQVNPPLRSANLIDSVGLLTPKSSTMAQIVFGEEYKERAIAIPEVVYVNNNQVKDFMWEIDEGQKVTFQAFEDSNSKFKWKTFLAWIGPKPSVPPLDIGNLISLYEKKLNPSIGINSQHNGRNQKSFSCTSSEWGSIVDDEPTPGSTHLDPQQQTSRPTNQAWWPTSSSSKILKKQNTSSLTSSSASGTPRKTPSPGSMEMLINPVGIATTINREVLESPLVTSRAQPLSVPMTAHVTSALPPSLPIIVPRDINGSPFYHPLPFPGLNMPPENQHVFNMESKIKELTQHVQLLENLIVKKDSVRMEDKSTQTTSNVPPAIREDSVCHATQTMSTGRVMYSELYHE